jgi:hypothetical protein
VSRYAAPGHSPLPIASASQVASGGEEEEATDDDESEGTSRKRRRTVSAKKATPPKKRRTSSGSASGSSGKKKKGGSAKATTESETDDEEADEDLPGSAASSITALNALVDPTSKYSLNAAQRDILRKSKNLTLEQSDLIRGSKVAEKGAKQKNIARKIREAEEHETKQRRKEIEDVVSAARKLSATQTPLIVAARKKRGGPNLTPAQILDLAEQFKKEARIELTVPIYCDYVGDYRHLRALPLTGGLREAITYGGHVGDYARQLRLIITDDYKRLRHQWVRRLLTLTDAYAS